MVEEDGSDIVQVSIERKKASPSLVRPDLDLIIIPPRDKQWLRFVKIDASDRAIMLLEPVYQGSHSIVP